MSRITRGCNPAGRNAVAGAAPAPAVPAMLRRGRVIGGVASGEGEEILDLLSRTRRGYSISSSGESDVLNRMEKKVSVGLAKAGRGAAEEFLSAEIGKHDYDWLLTPPGTPLFSSMDSTDRQPPSSVQRSSSNLRSASLVKPSRLSAPHSDDRSYAPTTARSSSTARTSLSNNTRTPSSAPNTTTSSVNSRPTTPNNRTRAPATATVPRPSTPRSTTPARSRPVATAQTSRPSTPTPRPSTPSRRPPPPVSTSRPSSPARSRTPVQLPERPVSAGRRGNSNGEVSGSGVSSSRRPSSPAVARGRVVAENQGKGRVNGHRDGVKMAENQKPVAPEKKPVAPEKKQVTVKPAVGGETGGYGRTLSKNSLNMAIKHMDIRQGMNGMRGVSLFPHSIRSTPVAAAAAATIKNPPASRAAPPPPSHKNRSTNHTSFITEPIPKNYNKGSSERDSIHLKEDERALNWLQSVDESHLFDRRFDPLHEPFILI